MSALDDAITKDRRRFLRGLIQIADPKIWVASAVPFALGQVLAYAWARAAFRFFDIVLSVLAMVALCLIETGKNAANECVDYASGVDRFVDPAHRTPFSGGKKTIVDGRLSYGENAVIAAVCFAAAALLGLIIASFRPIVLPFGAAGILISIFYSLPPLKLCYRGLGELAVGVVFGPLVLLGSYALTAGQVSLLPFLVSLSMGFLIANVLWINEYPDYEADKAGGKRNLVVRLGKQRAVFGYGALFALSGLATAAAAVFARNPVWLLPLLNAPKAVSAVRNCRANHGDIPRLVASNAATVTIYIRAGALFSAAAVVDALL